MTTLDELERLLKAGTPGPWHVGHNELGDAQGPMSIWPDANMIGAIIARCGPQQPWQGWYEQPAHDAALIVAAINALPGLLAICNAAKTALGLLDDPSCPVTGLDETRRARAILAAALKAPDPAP
jgi:hypothetical protein